MRKRVELGNSNCKVMWKYIHRQYTLSEDRHSIYLRLNERVHSES